MMDIRDAKLWCAAPALPPGTIKIEWRGHRAQIHSFLIEGNAADCVMEQYRAAMDDNARYGFLLSLIEANTRNREAA